MSVLSTTVLGFTRLHLDDHGIYVEICVGEGWITVAGYNNDNDLIDSSYALFKSRFPDTGLSQEGFLPSQDFFNIVKENAEWLGVSE